MTPCKNCGGSRRATHSLLDRSARGTIATAAPTTPAAVPASVDGDMIKCVYTHPNTSDHPTSGPHVFSQPIPGLPMQRSGNGWTMYYGYRAAGEEFYVHKKDVEAAPHWFKPVDKSEGIVNVARARRGPRAAPAPPPMPKGPAPKAAVQETPTFDQMIEDVLKARVAPPAQTTAAPSETQTTTAAPSFDFQTIPGVTDEIAEQMIAAGMKTAADVMAAGSGELQKFRGVGPAKAEMILAAAQVKLEAPVESTAPSVEEEVASILTGAS